MVKLAFRVRKALTSTSSLEEFKTLIEIKAQLPKVANFLASGLQTSLISAAYQGEYLYAYSAAPVDNRRALYTWVPGGDPSADIQSPFIFSTSNDGLTFAIKSLYRNEYMFPDTSLLDSSRRFVRLWSNQTLEPIFSWKVEILNEISIRIKSLSDEPLYAETMAFALNSKRRSIFAGTSGHICDTSCNWILPNCNGK